MMISCSHATCYMFFKILTFAKFDVKVPTIVEGFFGAIIKMIHQKIT